MRSILKLRNRTENAGNVSKVDELQTKTSSSASECWCVHILRELTIIGSLSINLLNNFTENNFEKKKTENSNHMSSEPVQIC